MIEKDSIKNLAKQILTANPTDAAKGNFLWERTQKLVQSTEQICQMPEFQNKANQIDLPCLKAAGYFSYLGSVLEQKKNENIFIIDNYKFTEVCWDLIRQRLTGVLDKIKTEKIISIIKESNSRFTKRIEAMILSDARNLDDIGVSGLINELSRYFIGGKNTSDFLQIWRTKTDYGYWQARLESFRFEAVRKIAEQRLKWAEKFMSQFAAENSMDDLKIAAEDAAFV